jgi:hypothetical protein
MVNSILRISDVKVTNSTTIVATFSHNLNTNISADNVAVTAQNLNISDPKITAASVKGNILTITCRPLTSQVFYYVKFVSGTVDFTDTSSTFHLIEDGKANVQSILGPIDSDNVFMDKLLTAYQNNIYDLESGTVAHDIFKSYATVFSKALADINQTKNENYLSKNIFDEKKTRGEGAFDRLNEESAYELTRVSKYKIGTFFTDVLEFTSFPRRTVNLLDITIEEVLMSSSFDGAGLFNINNLTLTVSKNFVSALVSVKFTDPDSNVYVYDIEKYGYQLLDNKYDPDFAFKYIGIENNQIRLSDLVLNDTSGTLAFIPADFTSVVVAYRHRDLSRRVDSTTVSIFNDVSIIREPIESLLTSFNLKHFPIVDSEGVQATVGGVVFNDPNSIVPFAGIHPAFKNEIVFGMDNLPASPGEYCVDYASGRVFVYGVDSTNNGTGAFPPVANYIYKNTYQPQIDYVYDADSFDLVAIRNRNLDLQAAKVSYQYEQVLVPEVDYKAHIHTEVLDERIGGSIIANQNALRVSNSPITKVFRVYNETQGEIYNVTRTSEDKIYFTFNSPPNIKNLSGERANFELVSNEILIATSDASITIASTSRRVLTFYLSNSNIISATEDCIGTSFNSSVTFSDTNLFKNEKYLGYGATIQSLVSPAVGDYCIDYKHGIVYCIVDPYYNHKAVGTVSYKRGFVKTNYPHVVNVLDIYYRRNPLQPKDKTFKVSSFGEGFIKPELLDVAAETALNNDEFFPYTILNGPIGSFIGATIGTAFVSGVTSNVKSVRHLFDRDAFHTFGLSTLDFANDCTFVDNKVKVAPKEIKVFGITDSTFKVDTGLSKSSIYDVFETQFLVTRLSDNRTFVGIPDTTGSTIKVHTAETQIANDTMLITCFISIKSGNEVIIDYNRGEYFVDYSYLADEIIVSYEYGDNVLDFRESASVLQGDTYYVSYRSGALRDALLKNFGSLIDIPELNVFDPNLNRERYRDALRAAFSSFTQGPTLASLKNIIQTITHVNPEVSETIFENWSLGNSSLYPQSVSYKNLQFTEGKFGDAFLLNKNGQEIKFPASSNIRLDEGTHELWVTPEWNGLDNQSELSFLIKKGNVAITADQIFIGAAETHPTLLNGKFTVSKKQIMSIGVPNMQKDGIFIYLAFDPLLKSDRWFVSVVNSTAATFSFEISTQGRYFDVKYGPGTHTGSSLTSTDNKVYFSTSNVGSSLTFVADNEHYFLDVGEVLDRNRISLYKDSAGYVNFRVIDSKKIPFIIGANVRNWKANEKHLIACSWILNSKNERDEMHLFIDGVEVPNVSRYGDSKIFGNDFRDVAAEELYTQISTKKVVSGKTFTTTAGSNLVGDSMGFQGLNIVVGDQLFINEIGFNTAGYLITAFDGTNITVSSNLPTTLTNVHFTLNKTSLTTQTSVEIYKNISVSKLPTTVSGIGSSDSGANKFTFTTINTGNILTVSQNLADSLLRIEADGFPHDFTISSISGNDINLNEIVPVSLTGLIAYIYIPSSQVELAGPRAITPDYTITSIGGVHSISILNNVSSGDLIKINSLGLNFRRFRKSYYQWGNVDNVLRTKFPTPISLDEVKIHKTILNPLALTSSTPTTLVDVPSKTFITTLTSFDTVSNLADNRKMQITITGGNLDYSAMHIDVTGMAQSSTITESIVPTKAGTYDLTLKYSSITQVKVYGKYIAANIGYGAISIKEKSSITTMDTSGIPPVIQFTFQAQVGMTLGGTGSDIVVDNNAAFYEQLVGGHVHIFTPSTNAGYYKILAVIDSKTIQIDQVLPTFSNTRYEILTPSINRNGFQNGFFTFEKLGSPKIPYLLTAGTYDFDYNSYISVKFDRFEGFAHIGTDINGKNLANAGLENIIVRSRLLTDTRVGEISDLTVGSITKEFNSLKPTVADSTMLVVLNPINRTISNTAYNYINNHGKYIQTGKSVNVNFGQSLVVKDSHLTIENLGILNTHEEGTIELWVNPSVDTGNDPNHRFFFDAGSTVSESLISTTDIQIVMPWAAASIVSVYVSGDSHFDFFVGGSLGTDGKTITLKRPLPNEECNVIVNYVPVGAKGDRISIYKDTLGNAIFNMRAAGTDFQIRTPIDWSKNSWHRLKASWKVNGGKNTDEIRFYVDGYERGTVVFGAGLLFGENLIFGHSPVGSGGIITTINFQDAINQFTIGSDFSGGNHGACLIDNLRISNISRPGTVAFNSSIDPNYNSNVLMAIPVTKDLYTTYLMDFSSEFVKNTDFALLKNKNFGAFDFSVNVLDSFGIVAESAKVKQVLEALVKSLKPANSRVYIKYNK